MALRRKIEEELTRKAQAEAAVRQQMEQEARQKAEAKAAAKLKADQEAKQSGSGRRRATQGRRGRQEISRDDRGDLAFGSCRAPALAGCPDLTGL